MWPLSMRARIVLASLIVIGALAEAWWLAHRPAESVQLFSLEPTNFSLRFTDETQFPVYDPVRNAWTIRGNLSRSIKPFIRNDGGMPDGIGKYIIIDTTKPATVQKVRYALLALIDQGICNVGVVDSESRTEDGRREVLVSGIAWVLSKDGQQRPCRPSVI